MTNRFIVYFFSVFFINCKGPREYSMEDFQNMNGYWQITEVIYPDGSKKKYNLGPAIDYIEVHGDTGFKKKVHPKLDGSYETSNDAITFRIVKKAQKGYFLSYNDKTTGWQDGINYLGVDYFSLKSDDGLVYCYDRYQPFELDVK